MQKNEPVNRRRFLIATGGLATVSAAGCLGDDDGDTDGDGDGDSDGDSDADGNGDPEQSHADKAQAAWNRIVENQGPDAGDLRAEAHVEIEEAVRDSAIVIPFMHTVTERFSYDYVEIPKIGALGGGHQQHHETELTNGDTELNLIINTFDHMDPVESDDLYTSTIITQLYERLVEYPHGVAELSNMLLDEFEVSDDGITYTFHLKEGVEYHDGRELTAEDVVYSWRRCAEAPNAARAPFLLSSADGIGVVHETDDEGNLVPDSLALEAVDDYTVEMEIQQPNPEVMDVLTYTSFSIMPEGLVGDIEGYDGEIDADELRQDTAVGTGPFEFDEFTVNEEFRATRFDNYHREPASIESLHYEISDEDEARYTYAMEGNADMFGIPTAHYDRELIEEEDEDDRSRVSGTYGPLENGETVNYLRVPELSISYFGFNAREVPQPVRQAIALVTDHEELVEQVYAGRAAVAYSFTPPGIWPTGTDGYQEFVDAHPWAPNETDLQGARDILQEAGYTEDEPFELTLTTGPSAASEEASILLRDKLAGNGVEISHEPAQFTTLVDRGMEGDLEMYALGWGWSWESPAYGHFGFNPQNTDTDLMPEEANGYYLNWHVELEEEG